MEIKWKKEVILITIHKGDKFFKDKKLDNYIASYGVSAMMDNTQYSRINGEWHVNTGGSELNWTKISKKSSKLLEDRYQEINN